MRKVDNFTLFFGADDALSNWHPCRFSYHGVDFTSVEQFMMFSKAKLFGDDNAAAEILAARHPKDQKAIGRGVKGFDLATWQGKRESIVYVGCREKFAQNPGLRSLLLATASTELVEASPYDRIWGVGLGERDPLILDKANWRGANLLGITLMKVRETLSH
ncbi:NADAR family protein [Paraburkholderia sabiae]|uniref:NADAR family protein n=1 Tax=Paraburkholderia sabiae TaxID=273251 RepID=A0ABU9QIZ7_9BURK|nr:NADAR family protein [Paraburkholderia sabiae]WJZ79736.1 NADAR family protein [Paraburkholderia sabiae]CAD6559414.1 Riboflavin biosynthesis protein [Paraburkholderia sabiae]